MGIGAIATGDSSISIGSASDARSSAAIAIGDTSGASVGAVAIGYNADAGIYSVAIGQSSLASSSYSVAIGRDSEASAENVIVINASGVTFPAQGVAQRSNVYISNIFNLNTTPTGNLATVGGRLYGAMYCNVQTGQICVIAQ